jgi:tetratricopeptide (TPR) repeat protein
MSTLSHAPRAFARITAALFLTGAVLLASQTRDSQAAGGQCDGRDTVQLATALMRQAKPDAQVYLCRARAYLATRNFRAAFADLNRAIKLTPKEGDLYLERARAYLFRADLRRALTDLNSAAALRPTARVFRERSAVHAELGNFELALLDLDAAIKLQPASADLYRTRGKLLAQRENFVSAESSTVREALVVAESDGAEILAAQKDFEFALELNPNDADAHLGLAYARRRIAADSKSDTPERYSAAIDSVNASLAIRPDSLEAMLLKADLFALGEDLYNARKTLERAIQKFPDRAEAYSLRGRILADERYFTAAIQDANKAIKLDRRLAEPYCVRATALSETNQTARAMRDFNTCLRLAADRETRDWASFELTALK